MNIPSTDTTRIDTGYIRNVWIPALRSGDYARGHHGLRSKNQFCCLGVLCNLLFLEDEGNARWLSESARQFFVFDGETNDLTLPRGVAQRIGITHVGKFQGPLTVDAETWKKLSPEAQRVIERGCLDLVALNDMGATFEDIANILEASIDGRATPLEPYSGIRW